MILQLPCLTEEECQFICKRLHQINNHWEPEADKRVPLYTLGAVSNIDARDKGEFFYKMKAKRLNPILRQNFSELYKKVTAALEKEINEPVVYDETYALPGFHMSLDPELLKPLYATIHFDQQFEDLAWRYQNVNTKNSFSITLPITLPEHGGGMYCWDIHHRDVKDLSKGELEKKSEEEEPIYIDYNSGEIVIHNGMLLHQNAQPEQVQPNDQRITLHGYAVFCDDAWRLYW